MFKSKKQYKSLGQMLKAGDFDTLLEDLKKMLESGELKNFNKRTIDNPISEFDELLFHFPKYACKTVQLEDGTIESTNELLPRSMEFLEFALKNDANPEAYMKNGENCYLKACEAKNSSIVQYLIENPYKKVDINYADGMGNDGLFYATMAESTEVIELLVKKYGFNPSKQNFLSNNESYLHFACGHGKEKSFDKLIELGADPTVLDNYGYKPYEMILAGYDEETIKEFDLNDPVDVKELKKWKDFYQKAKAITENYIANKKKFKTKF